MGSPSSVQQKKLSVLVIDNDRQLTNLLGAYFSTFAIRVFRCTRVYEGLQKLDHQKYNLILLEANLNPERSERVLQHIKDKGNPNNQTPVVLLTKDLDIPIPADSLGNIRCVLTKPFSLPELHFAVNPETL